jgi:hypothetical protein
MLQILDPKCREKMYNFIFHSYVTTAEAEKEYSGFGFFLHNTIQLCYVTWQVVGLYL